VHRGAVSWILEADVVSFFDSLDRTKRKEMLEIRVADGSLLRLTGKCLHVDVLTGAELSTPETGTAQGSVLSPLLGNVTLHCALDLWFETAVKPRLRGRATLIRYADDFVIGFEHEEDARRVLAVLGKRLARFGLTLHPDKTRLLPFRRPPVGQKSGKGSGSFDFLGFTLCWVRSRWGKECMTRRASLRRSIQSTTAPLIGRETPDCFPHLPTYTRSSTGRRNAACCCERPVDRAGSASRIGGASNQRRGSK